MEPQLPDKTSYASGYYCGRQKYLKEIPIPGVMDVVPIRDILLLPLQMQEEHLPAEWVSSCK